MTYDVSKATPRPWVHYDDSMHPNQRHAIAATGKTVAHICCSGRITAEEDAANAHHIVHCVNNHEALAEMVERLTDRLESECVDPDPEWHDSDQDVDDARALLASLKESA